MSILEYQKGVFYKIECYIDSIEEKVGKWFQVRFIIPWSFQWSQHAPRLSAIAVIKYFAFFCMVKRFTRILHTIWLEKDYALFTVQKIVYIEKGIEV